MLGSGRFVAGLGQEGAVHKFVARGLLNLCLAAVALMSGASGAIARPTFDGSNLESTSSLSSKYSVMSDVLWGMGLDEVPEPLVTAQAAVATNPNSAEAHLRLGLAAWWEDPKARASSKHEYEIALRLDPAMTRAYALMGDILSAEGDVAGTERNYKTWIAIAPNDRSAHLSYAFALARLKRMSEARAELDHSLKLGPTPAAYVMRAVSFQDAWQDSEADFDRGLALGRREAHIFF